MAIRHWLKHLILVLILASGFLSNNLARSETPSLKIKLAAQWQLYKKAQELLLEQVDKKYIPINQRAITRDQWEKTLALNGGFAFTQQDLIDLRRDQALRIKTARTQARDASIIDLDIVRSQQKTGQFCKKVPKGGMLHIHPFGTLDRQTADTLLHSLNPAIDLTQVFFEIDSSGGNISLLPQERSFLERIPLNTKFLSLSIADQGVFSSFMFLPKGRQTFSRFNGVFEFLGFAIPDWMSFEKVLFSFAQRAIDQGVIYVEFTTGTSAELFSRLGVLEKLTGLTIRTNYSFNRTADLATLDLALSQLLAAPKSPYLVGIDFLDNEETNPAFEKGQLLYGSLLQAVHSKKSELRRTMHAGELGDSRNPRDAMLMGAERLGHGVNLMKDPVALEYATLIRQPIEVNLSSNLRLTDVESISKHPFLDFLRLGLPVSLSTDDEGIFEIDINHECELAIAETDISYAEVKQMAFNSIQTSFASAADKKTLLEKLTLKFDDFERNNPSW